MRRTSPTHRAHPSAARWARITMTPGGVIVGMAVTAGSQNQGFSTGGHFTQTGRSAEPLCRLQRRAAVGQRHRELWPAAEPHRAPGDARHLHRPEQRQRRWPLAGAGAAGRLRFPPGSGHHRPGGRRGAAAGAHRRLHRNRLQRPHRPVVRQPDPGFGGQPARLARFGGPAATGSPSPTCEWNHEFADKNRTITASLTSIAAPSWSAAAVPIAANWATASVGVSYRVNPQVIVGAAASAHVRQSTGEQLWRRTRP